MSFDGRNGYRDERGIGHLEILFELEDIGMVGSHGLNTRMDNAGAPRQSVPKGKTRALLLVWMCKS